MLRVCLVLVVCGVTMGSLIILENYTNNAFSEDFLTEQQEKTRALLTASAQKISAVFQSFIQTGEVLRDALEILEVSLDKPFLHTLILNALENTPYISGATLVQPGYFFSHYTKTDSPTNLFWHKLMRRQKALIDFHTIDQTTQVAEIVNEKEVRTALYGHELKVLSRFSRKPYKELESLKKFLPFIVKRIKESGKRVILHPMHDFLWGGGGLSLTFPLWSKKTGQFQGILALHVSLEKLESLFFSLITQNVESLFLLDEKGRCCGHSTLKEAFQITPQGIMPQHISSMWKGAGRLFHKRHAHSFKSHHVTFKGNDEAKRGYLVPFAVLLPEAKFLMKYTLGGVFGDDFQQSGFVQSKREAFWLTVVLLMGIGVFIVFFAIRMTNPIHAISQAFRKMRLMRFEGIQTQRSFFTEIDEISSELQGVLRTLTSFGKLVPKALVKELLLSQQEVVLGGEERELTILFSDIKGFTSVTEKLNITTLTQQLTSYFDTLTRIIQNHRGTVDKYIGDAVMAFWGAPLINKLHALYACEATLLCYSQLKGFNERLVNEGHEPFLTRFGLSSGRVVVGNFGSEDRFQYTVLGDNVNLAARLEGLNKVYGTSILLSASTYQLVKDYFIARIVDKVAVKGKVEGVKIYELLCKKEDASSQQQYFEKLSKSSTEAFEAYEKGHFREALRQYQILYELFNEDSVAKVLVERCKGFVEKVPDVWDGIYRLQQK